MHILEKNFFKILTMEIVWIVVGNSIPKHLDEIVVNRIDGLETH